MNIEDLDTMVTILSDKDLSIVINSYSGANKLSMLESVFTLDSYIYR